VLERYVLHDELAVGGMATVHLGRRTGDAGFGTVVAIKRMHPHIARDPQLCAMFFDEARLVARIRHANVVPVIDVAATPERDLLLVMELVQGETLATLLRMLEGRGLPPRIAVAIMAGALNGLHAAHEATDERGRPLMLVHRDVSPQNIIVAEEGIARVLDFGIAKAVGRAQTTRDGQIKGKASYMAPEQLRGERLDRRVDVYAAGIVLWETLTGARLFEGDSPEEKVTKILEMKIVPPSAITPGVPPGLDAAVLKALARKRDNRFATAREMARAIEQACPPATPREVSDWVHAVAGPSLGGSTVLAFVALFPRVARRLLSICGTDAASAHAIALRSIQRDAVRADPAFLDGHYAPSAPPRTGLALARKIGTVTYRSADELQQRFGRRPSAAGKEFAVQDYLEQQADKFADSFDANSYLRLSAALDRFDLAEHGEPVAIFRRAALESALIVGVERDQLFTIGEQARVASALRAGGVPTTFERLDSLAGHDAFLIDFSTFDNVIRRWLDRGTSDAP